MGEEESCNGHVQSSTCRGFGIQQIAVLQDTVNKDVLLRQQNGVLQVGEIGVAPDKVIRHGRSVAGQFQE